MFSRALALALLLLAAACARPEPVEDPWAPKPSMRAITAEERDSLAYRERIEAEQRRGGIPVAAASEPAGPRAAPQARGFTFAMSRAEWDAESERREAARLASAEALDLAAEKSREAARAREAREVRVVRVQVVRVERASATIEHMSFMDLLMFGPPQAVQEHWIARAVRLHSHVPPAAVRDVRGLPVAQEDWFDRAVRLHIEANSK